VDGRWTIACKEAKSIKIKNMHNDDSTIHHQDITQLGNDNNTVLGSDATIAETHIPTIHDATLKNDIENYSSIETVPVEKGATILNLYRVESDAFVGGFGRVFRVHHTGWKVDLAMKQPKREVFQSKQQKDDFTNECKHWIELGLHPHIVSCYYVREIEGIPSIFAEWMNGGSLKDAICSEALYEGSEKEAGKRILDISIQFARGLHYAHEQGLIHRDVKPDNLLLTSDDRAKLLTAKVADFGIAGAKEKVAYTNTNSPEGVTTVKNGNAYTPRYCSPEQMKGENLTRRTDIWSWAVSVLEMYVGDHSWHDGTVAGMACEDYFEMARIPIPETMKDLLRSCFKINEAERPRDFGVVETELLKIYQTETGNAYRRPEPKVASHTADSLNNRALSYLDLGEPEEAEKCWEEALKIDPDNALIQYNQILRLWKTEQIDDLEAVYKLTLVSVKDENYYKFLAKLHLARADAESAIKCVNEAIAKCSETEDLKKALVEAQEMMERELDGRCICTVAVEECSNAACFSPDGKKVFLGSNNGQIKIWDTATGECICAWKGHTSWIVSFCFSPDGKQALSSDLYTVRLWNIETGDCIHSWKENNMVRSVCFSPNGKMVLLGVGHTVLVWDLVNGKCIRTLIGHTSSVYYTWFSPDGKLALSGSEGDNAVKLWNIEAGDCIHTLEGYNTVVRSVCFSPDGKQVLVGSLETIKIWDVDTGVLLRTLKWGNISPINSLCISPDGKLVLSGDVNYTVRVWKLVTGECLRTFKEHTSSIISVCFSPDGRRALSVSSDRKVKTWNIPVREPKYVKELSHIQSTEVAVKESDQFYSTVTEIDSLVAQKKITLALTKLKELQGIKSFASSEVYFEVNKKLSQYCVFYQLNRFILRTIPNAFDYYTIWDFYWSKEKNWAISSVMMSADIVLWNLGNGSCIGTLMKSHTEAVNSVCFSPDGRYALSGSEDRTVKLWDIEKGNCIRTLSGHTEAVNSVCFSPDGKHALSGSVDKTVKLWDIEKGNCIRILSGHTETVNSVCSSPDGKHVLSCSVDRTAKLWDTKTGKCIHTFEGYNPFADAVCFSPDGKMILYWDSAAKLWDVKTRKCTHTFEGHKSYKLWDVTNSKYVHVPEGFRSYIRSVCFSPNGKMALLNSVGGELVYTQKLWDIEAGRCIHTFEESEIPIRKVHFSPDGRQIVMATEKEIRIYTLDFDFHFPGWQDWNEGARPYLDIFLTLHPNWTDEDFNNIFIPDLQNRGYGWLRPEGVRVELEKMNNQKTSFWKRIVGGK
jgi:WD40 repeat protein